MDFQLITSDYEFKSLLSSVHEKGLVAIDTETTGLDPLKERIRLIQMAVPGEPVRIIDTWSISETIWPKISQLFSLPVTKIFHNAQFDLKFLSRVGIPVHGPFFDTMLAYQVLSTGLKTNGFKLSDLVKNELGEDLPKELQVSDFGKEVSREQLEYAARDAQVLLRLYPRLTEQLQKYDLQNTADLEFACLPAVVEMELSGILIDTVKWDKLSRKLEEQRVQAIRGLTERIEVGLRRTPGSLFSGDFSAINFDSPKQMLEVLQTLGLPVKNTSSDELSPLEEKYPVVRALIDYRKVTKVIQSFSNSLPKHIHPLTGRIHPDYWQIGTVTGRFSCKNPNLQQIPRDQEFRECFVPAPRHQLVIGDYSQIELRVAAEMTHDPLMTDAFRQGKDIHRLTASLLTGKRMEEVTKEERQAAKAVNFGLLYAMGARGLALYAQNSYGVKMTDQQAYEFRKKFFESYPGISSWQQGLNSSSVQEIRTLNGRLRKWPGKPPLTELLNAPVQGTAAEIMKQALAWLFPLLQGTSIHIIGTIHDEILLESPETRVGEAAQILKETMIRAGQKFLSTVPVDAEVVIASNWSEK
ncbi:MAG: bifunctional 3'-5' exonuclease/DNA polymerase [Candidatus Atribacteria bacterium]|nr:bifunctional 3'-5' exonuclease/DNA polymerase [Candidatus Atribacteria bacterium]